MKKLIPLFIVLATVTLYAAIVVTFQQATSDTADLATYTFNTIPIGTATADRCVVMSTESRRSTISATTLVSATINGNAATILGQHNFTEASSSLVAFISLVVPTGTTADFSMVISATMLRNRIGVTTLTGANCTTVVDTQSSDADDPTVLLDIPAGGAGFGVCVAASTTGSTTWTGLTERHDAIIESAMLATGASAEFGTIQTDLPVTCTMTNTNAAETGLFISLGPASAGSTHSPIIGGGFLTQ